MVSPLNELSGDSSGLKHTHILKLMFFVRTDLYRIYFIA